MNNLPNELLLKIFYHLNCVKNIINVSKVNLKFHKVSNDNVIWKNLYLIYIWPYDNEINYDQNWKIMFKKKIKRDKIKIKDIKKEKKYYSGFFRNGGCHVFSPAAFYNSYTIDGAEIFYEYLGPVMDHQYMNPFTGKGRSTILTK